MAKYIVHCYAVVRVPVQVEADSQAEAVEKAFDTFASDDVWSGEGEFADELQNNYLVDEPGDSQYERSTWYRFNKDGKVEPMDSLANMGGNA